MAESMIHGELISATPVRAMTAIASSLIFLRKRREDQLKVAVFESIRNAMSTIQGATIA